MGAWDVTAFSVGGPNLLSQPRDPEARTHSARVTRRSSSPFSFLDIAFPFLFLFFLHLPLSAEVTNHDLTPIPFPAALIGLSLTCIPFPCCFCRNFSAFLDKASYSHQPHPSLDISCLTSYTSALGFSWFPTYRHIRTVPDVYDGVSLLNSQAVVEVHFSKNRSTTVVASFRK